MNRFCQPMWTSGPSVPSLVAAHGSELVCHIRERLWPFLEYEPAPRRPTRPREDIVADLLRSNASIMLNLTR